MYAEGTYSFLMTSKGFVSTAPAIPATTDFTADLESWVFYDRGRGGMRRYTTRELFKTRQYDGKITHLIT